jgi:hypothetical protein
MTAFYLFVTESERERLQNEGKESVERRSHKMKKNIKMDLTVIDMIRGSRN